MRRNLSLSVLLVLGKWDVLCDKSLEKFSITKEDIENARSIRGFYLMFNAKRDKYFKTQYAETKKYVEYALREHKLGRQLIEALKGNKIIEVKKMLCERNRGAEEKKASRTVVLMDATGSMHHLLQQAKNAVDTMFERISIILKDNGRPPNSFEMQFVVYRNYNAPEHMLLQTSPWESKPENLRNFMKSVKAEENEKKSVSQVILIGDAQANTREDIPKKRIDSKHGLGEDYWKNTKLFSRPTYYEDELIRLKQCNIPVHAFYVEQKAQVNFKQIADSTSGRCEKLAINSSAGSGQLTNLVSEVVLKNVGGSKGNELVNAYRAKFSSSKKDMRLIFCTKYSESKSLCECSLQFFFIFEFQNILYSFAIIKCKNIKKVNEKNFCNINMIKIHNILKFSKLEWALFVTLICPYVFDFKYLKI
ncbi:hypothetical protein RFI_25587 [Reticulomyxa filosa]|uniref:VWFA domain-containing protein n=1 Tax=Reticulomyxa filosa TaxID=46433 RepID=X6MCQ0_RETFI|nr:hypothetical protein RFI_25587 [Reticulomyxa filosa]|eukprot:ETO11788.1 hypothetical protein RFI_25587 [Reticulomyxa filosa]